MSRAIPSNDNESALMMITMVMMILMMMMMMMMITAMELCMLLGQKTNTKGATAAETYQVRKLL